MYRETNIGKQKSGFTIVELLIVIVVIGILATITIVAYSGIQQRARDSVRTADIKQLQKALEFYYVDNGFYPSVGADGDGNYLSTLAAALVPKYITRLPVDPARLPDSALDYRYVREPAGSYGIRINYEAKGYCHMGMNNVGREWWGLSACQ